MKRRYATLLPAVAAVALIAPVGLAAPATAAPAASTTGIAAAPCGTNVADRDGSSWGRTADGAHMRSGSSTSCASKGIAYSGHVLDYHCFTGGSTHSWTFVRNDTTGVQGWIRDDLLSDGGSFEPCNL
ncbi:hypothetical protein [Streptomyces clavuligerus]|uniref:SH3 domain-containing protein n=1 Tax=Streptomyces clavuligerus TaxID=1901 RepID=E2Q008_STRCL|nr:hypothetical protein [Streptomyces clavuligerus]ANW18874.1 hypothetical protein BB341_11855 [Streptomyces clavuligerus]AXU13448.1 hypothetical protein D1794_12280 [Streptomyces clavuligerus]EFG08427.1 Hypothetical protein SCLAV_3356 [Streptomyces clavuligerus]MBY6303407.1 hypothetical protein [Streptomyces clavuligerus]QCS06232.1 hypothetical protein CRV15_11710 [Streptomyces clavuligerus]